MADWCHARSGNREPQFTKTRPRHFSATTVSRQSVLGVGMVKGGNILEFGKASQTPCVGLKKDVPVGIDPQLVANQPQVVQESVGHFTRRARRGRSDCIALVSFVSLGLRAGVVVAVCIPLVLAITFVVRIARGSACSASHSVPWSIALGLLVDDAIIAVEMMIRKLEEASIASRRQDSRTPRRHFPG